MDKIYNIKYVDAGYDYRTKLDETRLTPHEAYGYLEKNENNLIIHFIKRVGVGVRKESKKTDTLVKGLILPDTSLISVNKKFKTNKLHNIKINSKVTITWRDVIYVANKAIRKSSVMYTEGILSRVEKDHILLKNPETIRIFLAPIKNHPPVRPNFYLIPKSFITDVEIIKKKKDEKNIIRKK